MNPAPLTNGRPVMENSNYHETWSSRTAFLLAAIGAAVGLGNIWRFPYLVGENGGSAFVLVYILCIAAVGIPILIAELMMGRRGRMSPIGTMTVLAEEARVSRHWRKAGWLAVVTIFLAGTFYYVVASWVLAYVLLAIEGAFDGIDGDGARNVFSALMDDPLRLSLWFGIFMAIRLGLHYSRGSGGVGENPWDQHRNLESGHANMALQVDEPIAGLLKDLK